MKKYPLFLIILPFHCSSETWNTQNLQNLPLTLKAVQDKWNEPGSKKKEIKKTFITSLLEQNPFLEPFEKSSEALSDNLTRHVKTKLSWAQRFQITAAIKDFFPAKAFCHRDPRLDRLLVYNFLSPFIIHDTDKNVMPADLIQQLQTTPDLYRLFASIAYLLKNPPPPLQEFQPILTTIRHLESNDKKKLYQNYFLFDTPNSVMIPPSIDQRLSHLTSTLTDKLIMHHLQFARDLSSHHFLFYYKNYSSKSLLWCNAMKLFLNKMQENQCPFLNQTYHKLNKDLKTEINKRITNLYKGIISSDIITELMIKVSLEILIERLQSYPHIHYPPYETEV